MFLSSIFIVFKLFLVENFVQYILITFIFPPPILPRVVLSSLPTQLDALSPSRPIHAPQENKIRCVASHWSMLNLLRAAVLEKNKN